MRTARVYADVDFISSHPQGISIGMTLLWIPLTIAAAFLQNVRSALQKHLKGRLGTTGATFVRFGYGFPVAIAYLLALVFIFDFELPRLNPTFIGFVLMGGLAQITATALLVTLFDARNFAVGTTYSKTETIQAAMFALVFLGETISLTATIGILVSLAGVIAISVAKGQGGVGDITQGWNKRAALIGLASGGFFGIAAISVRGGSLSLGGDGFLVQAAFTLAVMLVFQTVVMGSYMAIRNASELREVLAAWRVAMWVGASGAVASIGWFTAMTIQNAALVRALGQIELVFTIAASVIVFREKIARMELVGISLVVAGILILLLH
jgi:drug/metabolite transporter (DMT)-like permease